MDPADPHHALSSQGALLGQHDQLLRTRLAKSSVMMQMSGIWRSRCLNWPVQHCEFTEHWEFFPSVPFGLQAATPLPSVRSSRGKSESLFVLSSRVQRSDGEDQPDRRMCCGHLAAWSSCLPWVEYAHNSLVSSASGVSPSMATFYEVGSLWLGYQPPLFDYWEEEVAVSAIRVNLHRCRSVWRQICSPLLHPSFQMQRQANHRQLPAPVYRPGQKVWLSMEDLALQVPSSKRAPCYMEPFDVDQIINTAAKRLKLPPTLKIHPAFCIWMGDRRPQSITFWMLFGGVEDHSFWWTGKDTIQSSARGFAVSTFWTLACVLYLLQEPSRQTWLGTR